MKKKRLSKALLEELRVFLNEKGLHPWQIELFAIDWLRARINGNFVVEFHDETNELQVEQGVIKINTIVEPVREQLANSRKSSKNAILVFMAFIAFGFIAWQLAA